MKQVKRAMEQSNAGREWRSVAEIPRFPFETFEQMQAAIAVKSFNVGVDPLAAAEWSSRFSSRTRRAVVAGLSLLLVIAAAASLIAALMTENYSLMLVVPIQAAAFYVSSPTSPIRNWITVGGAVSVVLFFNLLLNGWPIAATFVAYAGLTFAAVRAAGYITNAAFRKALLDDEELFLTALASGACTLRNNRTRQVYGV
jgi:hypothetical protein